MNHKNGSTIFKIKRFFKILPKIRLHLVHKHTDIVVLDDWNSFYLEKLISKYSCIHLRREYIDLYVSMLTPIYFMDFLLKLRNIYKSVYLASIKTINPLLCITYIDNDKRVALTTKYLQPIRTIAIQNGQRTSFSVSMPSLIGKTIDTYVSFGSLEVDEFRQAGINVINHIPFGSLKNVLYRMGKHSNVTNNKEPYILYVSQFRKNRIVANHETVEGYHKIITNAIKVAELLKIRLCVMLKNKIGLDESYDEVQWYKNHGFKMEDLISNDECKLIAYDVIENAQLVIGFASTLLREGFGRGKKTLFVNYTGNEEYDFPLQGIWRLIKPSDKTFLSTAVKIYKMPIDSYKLIFREAAEYVCLNPDNMNILNYTIDSYIETARTNNSLSKY
jgi:surface carbohydrate biosynthesis protein